MRWLIAYEPAAYSMASSMAKRSGAPSAAPWSITLRSPSFEDPPPPRLYELFRRGLKSRLESAHLSYPLGMVQ